MNAQERTTQSSVKVIILFLLKRIWFNLTFFFIGLTGKTRKKLASNGKSRNETKPITCDLPSDERETGKIALCELINMSKVQTHFIKRNKFM